MLRDIHATIQIDLSKSEEELWENADKDAKWGVKKAEKEGLKVEQSDKEDDWKRFYEIYKKTIIYGGIVPDKFSELKEKGSILFVCKKDGMIIAGAIIQPKDTVYELKYNASLNNFLRLQPNNTLYWELIKWGKNKGFKTFDLGGYQINASGHLIGVNKFKERWGGELKEYYIQSKNPFYILGRKIIRNIPFIKSLREKIKIFFYNASISSGKLFRLGFARAFSTLFSKLIYDNRKILIYSVDLNEIAKIKPNADVRFAKAGIDSLQKIAGIGYPIYENYQDRIDNGNECFIGILNDKVVHSSWLNYNEMDISEADTKIPLEKDEACIFDCYTSSESRGLGIYPAMLTSIQEYLKNGGFSKCYIYVDSKNEPSIKGIEKARFRKSKILKSMKILFFRKRVIEEVK